MYRATLQRYQNYLMLLERLRAAGRVTVTSEELAAPVGVTASRVRQDMTALRTLGKPRAGYVVSEVESLIHAKLDIVTPKPMALVGVGKLGRLLAESDIWGRAGFELVALFDRDPAIVGTCVGALTVQHVKELLGTVRGGRIVAGCITVPSDRAQEAASLLVAAGIRAVWNFALVDLDVPETVIVENQRLEQGLMTLSYMLGERARQQDDRVG